MQRIVVLNPKGGSGKTTVATNLASHFALHGEQPLLMDYDVQGSSSHWVRKRPETQPHVQLISVFERNALANRTFDRQLPDNVSRLIIDTPAAVEAHDMPELTRTADKILIPVLPSDIDIMPARAWCRTCCWLPRCVAAKIDWGSSPIACAATP